MTDTVRSPPLYLQIHSSRSQTTTAAKPAMTPFFSPQPVVTPQQQPPSMLAQPGSSPNYFGYQSDNNAFLSDSSRHVKANWSPPSSAVRSAVAVSPSFVPVDQNPDYEAFRRQSDNNKSLNAGGLNGFQIQMPAQRPVLDRAHSIRSPGPHGSTVKPASGAKDVPASSHRNFLDPHHSDLSRSPKRMLSSSTLSEAIRRGSPPIYADAAHSAKKAPESNPSEVPRFELSLGRSTKSSTPAAIPRGEYQPESQDTTAEFFVAPERLVNLMAAHPEEMLILDLRVSTLYAHSHISSALSLCVPTTLLKRPKFDVRKLAETFQDKKQRETFEHWNKNQSIVVYDSNSAALKDATMCLNTIKKFQNEGYEGSIYILKGGFAAFSNSFPSYVVSGATQSSDSENEGPEVAPVIGGCPMPITDAPANPFFGNIRQNMDLIGGVGLMPIKPPKKASAAAEKGYPMWLKKAAASQDEGKSVSKKFEQIEWREKKRMEDALSGKVSYDRDGPSGKDAVRIAGLEKGEKNRYNNIWPFEHSRVKLQGVTTQGCDYINASHIKSSYSHKSYISTQAPVPGTFNDFWNVVWQQDVRVIVMLTAEFEGAQIKAHRYWEQKRFGPLHLSFLSEKRASLELDRIHKHLKRPPALQRQSTTSVNPNIPLARLDSVESKDKDNNQSYVFVRKFTLKHDKYPFEPMREITQLHYAGWPDFGAPADPAHLLGLIEQCDAVVRANNKTSLHDPEPPNKRPMLVHCSAGCGRTGTFCTVDSVIDMLKRQRLSRARDSPSTAMDIDKVDLQKSAASEPTDFFTSKSTAAPVSRNDSLDGSWLGRDDLDLVDKTVEEFRHQRISMVQSLRQFVLCYESVMEWIVDQESANHHS